MSIADLVEQLRRRREQEEAAARAATATTGPTTPAPVRRRVPPASPPSFEISEQCWLIDYIDEISSRKGSVRTHIDRNRGSSLGGPRAMLEPEFPTGDAAQEAYLHLLKVHHNQTNYDFLDNINVPYDLAPLLEQLPKEFMASLQPYFKMYKVFYRSEEDHHGVKVLFPFNNFVDQSFTRRAAYWSPVSTNPGSMAVGFKGLTLDYLGTNPATVDAFINCGMTIYASTVHALFKNYEVPDNLRNQIQMGQNQHQNEYSFIDLISPPPRFITSEDGHKYWNSRYFRIMLEIGYIQPTDEILNAAFKGPNARQRRESFRNFLTSSKVTFFLTLKRHKIRLISDVPSAPVELELSFNACIEETLNSVFCDLLSIADNVSPLSHNATVDPDEEFTRITNREFSEGQVQILSSTNPSDIFEGWLQPATLRGVAELTLRPSFRFLAQRLNLSSALRELPPIVHTLEGLQTQEAGNATAFYPDGTPMFGPWRIRGRHRQSYIASGLNTTDRRKIEDIANYYFWSAMGAVSDDSEASRAGGLSRTETRRFVLFRELLDRLVGPDPGTTRATRDRTGVLLDEWYTWWGGNQTTAGLSYRALLPYHCRIFSQRVRSTTVGSDTLSRWARQRKRMKYDDDTTVDIQRAIREGDIDTANAVREQFARDNIGPAQGVLGNPRTGTFPGRGTEDIFRGEVPSDVVDSNDEDQAYSQLYDAARDAIKTNAPAQRDARDQAGSPTLAEFPRFSEAVPRVRTTNPSGRTSPTAHVIRWLYFGDIIDNAINFACTEGGWGIATGPQFSSATHFKVWNRRYKNDERHQANLKFVMGKLPYVRHLGPAGPSVGPLPQWGTMDLARFPVSFRSYISFLKRYLVDSDRLTLTLDLFIKKALEELVISPLNRSCKINSLAEDVVWEPIIELATIPLDRQSTTEIRPSLWEMRNQLPPNYRISDQGPENWFSPDYPWSDTVAIEHWSGGEIRDVSKTRLVDTRRDTAQAVGSLGLNANSDGNFEFCNNLAYLITARSEMPIRRAPTSAPTYNPPPGQPDMLHDRFEIDDRNLSEENIYFIGVRAEQRSFPHYNDRARDRAAGVIYIDPYMEGSPIYTLSFDRTDQPYVAEARAQMSGVGSNAFFQREFYNATVTTVGNTVLKAGKYAFINVPHFGDINREAQVIIRGDQDAIPAQNATPARKLGLGGYYFIWKTQHQFRAVGDRLEWKTIAYARWEGFGHRVPLI